MSDTLGQEIEFGQKLTSSILQLLMCQEARHLAAHNHTGAASSLLSEAAHSRSYPLTHLQAVNRCS